MVICPALVLFSALIVYCFCCLLKSNFLEFWFCSLFFPFQYSGVSGMLPLNNSLKYSCHLDTFACGSINILSFLFLIALNIEFNCLCFFMVTKTYLTLFCEYFYSVAFRSNFMKFLFSFCMTFLYSLRSASNNPFCFDV